MKNHIPKAFIQDVVARSDIVSVIASRIELKKRGHTHTACCPFHSEKTPSFTVSQTKQFYYCFGCGAHGNVIGFLMEYDHLSFIDAITDLAQQLGMTVPLESADANNDNHDALYTQLFNAQKCYENALKQSTTAIDYLKNRGLTGKIAKTFGIGYAPNAWEFLSQQLGKNRAYREALATAGMLIEKNAGHYYDRFRDRIMFPIRDIRGKTIGFGGRTLTNEIPKYLNSPETPVFHKNQTLYGLYEVCQKHRKLQRILVVEGYLDVISLAQHEVDYAVATLGTALNVKHIQLLLRYTSDIIFCFDGDNAGQKAAWKALLFSLPLLRDGLNIRFLFLPQHDDPDSCIRKIGKQEFEKSIDQASPLSSVFFDQLEKEFPTDSIAGKAGFAKAAHDLINTMPTGIYKNLLLDELANRLHIARTDITSLTTKMETADVKPTIKTPQKKSHTALNPAQIALQILLRQPALASTITLQSCFEDDKTADKTLLLDMIALCQQKTFTHLGELLAAIEDDTVRATLARIAALPLPIPDTGCEAELTGAIRRLAEQDFAQKLSALIAKAKETELTPEEKVTLQQMLTKKHAQSTEIA